jgi:hypothetical protein
MLPKIANHVGRSERCSWCLLPCCILLLSEGCFMIGVLYFIGQLYLVFVGALMYFSGHISGQIVLILLCGSEHAAIEIANS